jgi:hypothetical protein
VYWIGKEDSCVFFAYIVHVRGDLISIAGTPWCMALSFSSIFSGKNVNMPEIVHYPVIRAKECRHARKHGSPGRGSVPRRPGSAKGIDSAPAA